MNENTVPELLFLDSDSSENELDDVKDTYILVQPIYDDVKQENGAVEVVDDDPSVCFLGNLDEDPLIKTLTDTENDTEENSNDENQDSNDENQDSNDENQDPNDENQNLSDYNQDSSDNNIINLDTDDENQDLEVLELDSDCKSSINDLDSINDQDSINVLDSINDLDFQNNDYESSNNSDTKNFYITKQNEAVSELCDRTQHLKYNRPSNADVNTKKEDKNKKNTDNVQKKDQQCAKVSKEHRLKFRMVAGPRPFGCLLCELHFSSLEILTEHQFAHKKRDVYFCSICNSQFKFSMHFLNHKCSKFNYPCISCKEKADMEGYNKINKNISYCDHNYVYFCKICYGGRKKEFDIKSHECREVTENCYSCNVCELSFKTTYGLLHHRCIKTNENRGKERVNKNQDDKEPSVLETKETIESVGLAGDFATEKKIEVENEIFCELCGEIVIQNCFEEHETNCALKNKQATANVTNQLPIIDTKYDSDNNFNDQFNIQCTKNNSSPNNTTLKLTSQTDSQAQKVIPDSKAKKVTSDSQTQKVTWDSNAQKVISDIQAQTLISDSKAQKVKPDSQTQKFISDSKIKKTSNVEGLISNKFTNEYDRTIKSFLKEDLKCKICCKTFSNSSILEIHSRIHNVKKPHLCQECGKTFMTAQVLDLHARNHVVKNTNSEKDKFSEGKSNNNLDTITRETDQVRNKSDRLKRDKCFLKRKSTDHTFDVEIQLNLVEKQLKRDERTTLCDNNNSMATSTLNAISPKSLDDEEEIDIIKQQQRRPLRDKKRLCESNPTNFKLDAISPKNKSIDILKLTEVEENLRDPGKISSHNSYGVFKTLENSETNYNLQDRKENHIEQITADIGKILASNSFPYNKDVTLKQSGSTIVEKDKQLPDKPLHCKFCPSRFLLLGSLKRHEQLHVQNATAKRNYVCKQCDVNFGYLPGAFSRHMRDQHSILLDQIDRESHIQIDYDNSFHTSNSIANVTSHSKAIENTVSKYSNLDVLKNQDKDCTCNDCGKQFSSKGNLTNHIKNVHFGIRPFSCTKCDKTFAESSKLRVHDFIHSGIKPFTCVVCLHRSNQRGNWVRHQISLHANDKEFKCLGCTFTFETLDSLVNHTKCCANWEKFKEKGEKKRNTFVQGKETPKIASDAKVLKRPKFNSQLENNNIRSFSCTKCDKTFTESSNLRRHDLIHTDIKPFTCVVCLHRFRHRGNWVRHHINLHASDKEFKCLGCTFTFKTLDSLVNHTKGCLNWEAFKGKGEKKRNTFIQGKETMRMASDGKVLRGPKSNSPLRNSNTTISDINTVEVNSEGTLKVTSNSQTKVISHSKAMENTVSKHSNLDVINLNQDKNCICNYCDQRFANKSDLSRHIKSAHGGPFTCKTCDETFFDSSQLKAHASQAHSDFIPYTCVVCADPFSRRTNWALHQMIHVNDQEFKCIGCTVTFETLDSLVNHSEVCPNWDLFTEMTLRIGGSAKFIFKSGCPLPGTPVQKLVRQKRRPRSCKSQGKSGKM